MKFLGSVAQQVRNRLELTQQEVAKELGITVVHLSNIENDKAMPSADLLSRYHTLSGVDLYVMKWAESGDVSSLPKPVQDAAAKLKVAWAKHLSP